MAAGRPRGTQKHIELSGLAKKRKKYYGERNNTQLAPLADMSIEAPKKYSRETRMAWDLIVPNLIAMEVLTEVDLPSLQMMFDAYEEYVQAKKTITKFEKIHTMLEPDYIIKRKALNTWMTNSQVNFNKIAARFGLMPTERSRLPINGGNPGIEEKDPIEVVLA